MAGCEITQVYAGIAGGHIKGVNSTRHGRGQGQGGPRRPTSPRCSSRPRRSRSRSTATSSTCSRRSTTSTARTASASRSACAACASRRRCTSSPPPRPPRRTSSSAAHRCDLEVPDIVLEPLASGEAVLDDDEKELGVALVDIGGGTTDIAIFTEGAIVHTSVIPIGGHQLTNDIAFGLRTPPHEAERSSTATAARCRDGRRGRDDRGRLGRRARAARAVAPDALPRHHPAARRGDLLVRARREIVRLGCEDMLASGAVITGGTTLLAGMTELGEEILGMPVRRGVPKGVGGLVEVVATPDLRDGVGLVQYGVSRQSTRHRYPMKRGSAAHPPLLQRVLARGSQRSALGDASSLRGSCAQGPPCPPRPHSSAAIRVSIHKTLSETTYGLARHVGMVTRPRRRCSDRSFQAKNQK